MRARLEHLAPACLLVLAMVLGQRPAIADEPSGELKDEASSGRNSTRDMGWVLIGVGATCVLSAVVVFGIGGYKYSTRDGDVPTREDVDSLRTYRTTTQVMGAAGLLSAGLGVTLILTSPTEPRRVSLSGRWGQVAVVGSF